IVLEWRYCVRQAAGADIHFGQHTLQGGRLLVRQQYDLLACVPGAKKCGCESAGILEIQGDRIARMYGKGGEPSMYLVHELSVRHRCVIEEHDSVVAPRWIGQGDVRQGKARFHWPTFWAGILIARVRQRRSPSMSVPMST